MSVILNFSDIECLNESAAGSMGAGMASFVRAGFPAVRGFAVTPVAFSDFLKREEVAAALDLFRSGAEAPDEGWRTVKAVFSRSRLNWSHEIGILSAYGEIGPVVSILPTSLGGSGPAPVYASSGQDLLEGIKHCWLRWLRTGMDMLGHDMPAVVVREVVDTEASAEIRRKGQEFRVRAVFGLPDGLQDPGISPDIFEFKPDRGLERMEMRPQDFQYVMKGHGPARVGISGDLRGEEKLSGEMLASLEGILAFMGEHQGMRSCSVCFVSGRPLLCSAMLLSESAAEPDMPARERSISLLEPETRPVPPMPQAPVVATRIFLRACSQADLDAVHDTYLDGVIIPAGALDAAPAMASEAKRRFGAPMMVLEFGGSDLPRLHEALRAVSGAGLQTGILVPGIRSSKELAKVTGELASGLEGLPKPAIWARVMYPSNLFFIESLAGESDVLALDIDNLARLMVGGGEGAEWLHHTVPALERALEGAFARKSWEMAVLSDDIVSMPGMLEFLVRRGADIICPAPGEVHTVKHIIASLERRMLLERGSG